MPLEIENSDVEYNVELDKKEYIWTESIERILDKMRINCVNLSEYHMYKYRRYKRYLMMFRIPIIILSGINVFTAVGLQQYVNQSSISIINSIISLVCGMITSVELFLNIQKKMESDLVSHKDYYRLSIDIFKVISLERNIRKVDGKTFLDQKFSEYEKLIKSGNVFDSEYIFDTLSSQYPVVPSITKFIDPDAKNTQVGMLTTAKDWGNQFISFLCKCISTDIKQKKREKCIKDHRDKTAEYFYKDVHILSEMETSKEAEVNKRRERVKAEQMNRQIQMAGEAAAQAAALARKTKSDESSETKRKISSLLQILGSTGPPFQSAAPLPSAAPLLPVSLSTTSLSALPSASPRFKRSASNS
jgi:hypothetical protein